MDTGEREEVKNGIKALVSANPKFSLRKAAYAVGVSYSTARNIVINELHLKPYKYRMCHKLKDSDYPKRVEFARWYLSRPSDTPKYFICSDSDEAYFYLTESINKQNNRMWCESRPTNWIEIPLHDEKIHVWCAISANRILGHSILKIR